MLSQQEHFQDTCLYEHEKAMKQELYAFFVYNSFLTSGRVWYPYMVQLLIVYVQHANRFNTDGESAGGEQLILAWNSPPAYKVKLLQVQEVIISLTNKPV